MKTMMKKMTLTAALLAALSTTAPAQAEDSTGASLYVPYQVLSAQIRKQVAMDFSRSNAELGRQIQAETQAVSTASATADAREQQESKNREGAFWM